MDPSAEKSTVVKSNRLVLAKASLSVLEQRVLAMLISQLRKDDTDFRTQCVCVKDMVRLSGKSSGSLYSRVETICQNLVEYVIHVRTEDKNGKRRYAGYPLFSVCRYEEDDRYIEAEFNPKMIPLLLQLKRRFTMYQLQDFMRLDSAYAMRLYEILRMRAGLRNLTMSVAELREVLGCEDIYDRFGDFRRNAIDKARDDIHEKTSLRFRYTVERKGQTPVSIHFKITELDDAIHSREINTNTRAHRALRVTVNSVRDHLSNRDNKKWSDADLARITRRIAQRNSWPLRVSHVPELERAVLKEIRSVQ